MTGGLLQQAFVCVEKDMAGRERDQRGPLFDNGTVSESSLQKNSMNI